jgi:hypothetical protein
MAPPIFLFVAIAGIADYDVHRAAGLADGIV